MKKSAPARIIVSEKFSLRDRFSRRRIIIELVCILLSLLLGALDVFSQHSVTTHAGSSQGFADATGTAAKFKAPTGLCISPDGTSLYVADYSGHRIRKINVATKAVTTIAGNGSLGSADGNGTATTFSYPTGVRINESGTALYVCDYGNSKIRKIDLSTLAVTTIAGNGSFAYLDHSNGLSASFNGPTDLINDGDSVLYISDTDNHLIRKINLATSAVSTVAGMAGVGGFQNGVGTNAAFRLPKGLAIAEDHLTLYVADNGNNMIRAISLSTKNVSTVAGDGTAGYADNTNGALAKLSSPNGVATVPGRPELLFVADNVNHRIRQVNLNTTAVTTIAGTGAVPPASTYGDHSVGMNAKFFYPTNLVVSPNAEDIFVADQGNFRLRKVKSDLSTGIEDMDFADAGIMLYPNPADHFITITNIDAAASNGFNMEVIDSTGKLVYNATDIMIAGPGATYSLDISSYASGLYFLRIVQEGISYRGKILVSN
jgi:sugar lactone lactonase YvrE